MNEKFKPAFVSVVCSGCESMCKVYNYTKTIVRCNVCDKIIAKPTGSYFKNYGAIYEV